MTVISKKAIEHRFADCESATSDLVDHGVIESIAPRSGVELGAPANPLATHATPGTARSGSRRTGPIGQLAPAHISLYASAYEDVR
jgi:hypothetical protein